MLTAVPSLYINLASVQQNDRWKCIDRNGKTIWQEP